MLLSIYNEVLTGRDLLHSTCKQLSTELIQTDDLSESIVEKYLIEVAGGEGD